MTVDAKDSTGDKPTQRRVGEGVLLAGVTLGGYALAFFHEAGFTSHFGVPLDFISIDITMVLIASAAWIALAWFLFILLNPLAMVVHSASWPTPIKVRLGRLVYPGLVFAAMFYLYGPRKVLWISALVLAVVVVFFDYLLPLFIHRGRRTYLEKLAASTAEDDGRVSDSPIILLAVRLLGPVGFSALFFATLIVYGGHVMGRAEAERREWFYRPAGSTDIVLVRTYGATVLGARYDPSTHRLTGELVIGSRGEGQWTQLLWEHVGRLEQVSNWSHDGAPRPGVHREPANAVPSPAAPSATPAKPDSAASDSSQPGA